jgi:2-alkenal reductase
MPTLDEGALISAVLDQVETRFVQPTVTPAATVDAAGIKADVLTEVETRLIQPTPTPMPTLDANAVAAAVLEESDVQSALAAAAQALEYSLVNVYEQANPSVVFIVVELLGSGSGFVYSEDGYIVTNNHVVADGGSIEVIFANGERRRAETVGLDADSDLAVIKVEDLPEDVDPLPLADPDDLRVGQFVVAIGNPFGEQGSMSMGIVSGLGRSLRSQRERALGNTYSLPQVIQTDAPINPGNSGGPLLNLQGEVVGVNSAIATLTGTNSGVGFSIPVAAVRRIVPSLIEEGTYAYPYMGAAFAGELTLDAQEELGLPQTRGAYVLSVTPGSPADEAGLIPADSLTGQGGDLIVKIDDREITDFEDLNSYLVFHTTVGQTIDITLLRDGDAIVLPLTLGVRP